MRPSGAAAWSLKMIDERVAAETWGANGVRETWVRGASGTGGHVKTHLGLVAHQPLRDRVHRVEDEELSNACNVDVVTDEVVQSRERTHLRLQTREYER